MKWIVRKLTKYWNLSKGEQKAPEDLQEREDIVIVNVNIGRAVVIMDVTNNLESWKILNNKEHYYQLSKDQTAANSESVNIVIERFQK